VEIRRVETEPALVAGVGQLGREAEAERRTPGRLGGNPNLRGDDDIVASGAGPTPVCVIESLSWMPPSICNSAIELMPKLRPSIGSRSRLPCRPDAG
jgi:hypothetical protein